MIRNRRKLDAPLPAPIQDFVRLLADGIENRVYTIAATAMKLCPQLDGVGNYLLSAVRPIGTGLRGEPLEAFA